MVAAARARGNLHPMRRDTISERRMKCGQMSCACHQSSEARHGPYFTMNRVVAGKTRSRYLTPEQAELARQQAAAGQEFRAQVEAAWETCERWGDAQLDAVQAASQGKAAKKGASKRPSRLKPSKRSKP
ncbi:MAG: DUF6788 family protein [Acidobacteriota bacterium]